MKPDWSTAPEWAKHLTRDLWAFNVSGDGFQRDDVEVSNVAAD